MSVTIPDPQAEFFAQDPTILTEPELLQEQAVQDGHKTAAVSVGLGAAYLVYRQYMKRKLAEEVGKKGANITRTMLLAFASALWNGFIPRWVSMTAPYLAAGYQEGIRSARSGTVEIDVLEKIARNYAIELGTHLNEVSAEAMVSGFQAQVNRRVPAYMAAKRVADAYGVPKRGMNALVNVWTTEEKPILSDRVLPSAKADRAQAIIESQNALRARQIGDNEYWASRTQGKQLVWMYGQQKGTIPSSARRVWITANDERVCEICGPMDGVEAPVGEKFNTSAGELWTPPSHVNCRCDLVLDVSGQEDIGDEITAFLEGERVSKAAPGDKYDRDPRGRFARAEHRNYRPYKEREADIDAMLAQVNATLRTPVDTPEKQKTLGPPTLGATPTLGTKALNTPTLSTPALNADSKPGLGQRVSQRVGGGVGNRAISINLRGALFDGGPISKEPVSTFEGTWFPLDKPLVYMNTTMGNDVIDYSKEPMILVDSDEDFYEMNPHDSMPDKYERSLARALHEHWSMVERELLNEWWDKTDDERAYYDEDTGLSYEIQEDDYMDALVSAINHADQDEGPAGRTRLYGFGENHDNFIEVPLAKIARYTDIYADIADYTPHLIVVKHGFPGVTERKHDDIWTNPGKFKLIGDATSERYLTHYDYQIHYAEPVDLISDDLPEDHLGASAD